MTMTIREPEKLGLAIDRIHDRWFDVDAITYDPGTRIARIPFWSRPTSKAPLNRAMGEKHSHSTVSWRSMTPTSLGWKTRSTLGLTHST